MLQLLSDEQLTPAAMKHHLLMTMRNNTQLNFDVFNAFYQQAMLPVRSSIHLSLRAYVFTGEVDTS